ncbi:hypothetical protein N5D88_12010 [Aeromonas caviae]|uniref:hypothetical protein n=1 Tax=Aeromonas caviae TaxID=648 RepID=UPI0024477059|nr:hypothetical protein [Aeromonas caviae]MDH1841142.1 hypothetical protein [Aeromonas caviae]
MSQEIISDFLIKFGFDAKNVEKGLKNLTRLTDNYEKKLKNMAIAPKIQQIEQKFKQAKQPKIVDLSQNIKQNIEEAKVKEIKPVNQPEKVNPKQNKQVLTAEQKLQKQITAFTKKQLNTQFVLKMKSHEKFELARKLSSQKNMDDARREMALFSSNHRKRIQSIREQAKAARQAALASRTQRVRGAVTTAVGVGAGVVGGGIGISELKNQENKIKQTGQQFESIVASAVNAFGQQDAMKVLKEGARISQKYGSSLIDTSESLINFIALMATFGDSIDKSVKTFEQQQTALNFFGLKQQEQVGFMQQASQAFASNTLDSYQEAFRQWAPRMKADFETWLKNNKGIKDFTKGLTSNKYNLKSLFGEYLGANSARFEQGAKLVSSGSAANEQRALNKLTSSIGMVFVSSGFQNALEYSNKLLISFAGFLNNNSEKIGKMFEIVNKGLLEGTDKLLNFLSKLTEQDIEKFGKQLTDGVSMFYDIMVRLYNFLDKWLPKSQAPLTSEQISQSKQRNSLRESQTSNWRNSTYAPALQIKELTKPKTIPQVLNSPNYTIHLNVENAKNLDESKLAEQLNFRIKQEVSDWGRMAMGN